MPVSPARCWGCGLPRSQRAGHSTERQQQCGWAPYRIDWNLRNDDRSCCRCNRSRCGFISQIPAWGLSATSDEAFASSMPYPLGCPRAHGPVSAHPPKKGRTDPTRPGSLARVTPVTGWNPTDSSTELVLSQHTALSLTLPSTCPCRTTAPAAACRFLFHFPKEVFITRP